MTDITYCTSRKCPFHDCERSIYNAPKDAKWVSFANLDGSCKTYLAFYKEQGVYDETN